MQFKNKTKHINTNNNKLIQTVQYKLKKISKCSISASAELNVDSMEDRSLYSAQIIIHREVVYI